MARLLFWRFTKVSGPRSRLTCNDHFQRVNRASFFGNEDLRLLGSYSRGLKYGSHRDGLMFGRIPWMLERRVTSPWAMDPCERA